MRLQGYIYGEGGTSIRANVLLYDPATRSSQVIEILPGEQYTIDGDESAIEKMLVTISATGYADYVTTVSDLIFKGGNVALQRPSAIVPIIVVSAAALALMKKGGKVGAASSGDLSSVVLVGGVLLVANVISKILDKLGLGGDPSKDEQADPGSPWKPAYWHQFSSFTYAINEAQARAYSETIHDAFGLFQDDYNEIMSVFSALRTKANVSYLAEIFAKVYNEDLLSFLTDGGGILPWDGLSKEHLQTILAYVDKLPTH